MNRLSKETIKQATIGVMMTTQEVSSYSHKKYVRLFLVLLLAKTLFVEALVEAGLALYPE